MNLQCFTLTQCRFVIVADGALKHLLAPHVNVFSRFVSSTVLPYLPTVAVKVILTSICQQHICHALIGSLEPWHNILICFDSFSRMLLLIGGNCYLLLICRFKYAMAVALALGLAQ